MAARSLVESLILGEIAEFLAFCLSSFGVEPDAVSIDTSCLACFSTWASSSSLWLRGVDFETDTGMLQCSWPVLCLAELDVEGIIVCW